MNFDERLELYKEGGMLTDNDVKNVNAIITMFKDDYGVTLEEENADFFIAHICAAYGRNVTKEEIDPLPDAVRNELEGLDTYNESLEVLKRLLEVTDSPLSDIEKDYALLHINNIIRHFKESGEWKN